MAAWIDTCSPKSECFIFRLDVGALTLIKLIAVVLDGYFEIKTESMFVKGL